MANVVDIIITSRNLARPGFEAATADARGLEGTMGKMSKAAMAGLAGIGYESVKMASSYQTSTTQLVTSAGESVDHIDMVRKGMLDMAGQVGVSAQDLSKSMYFVEAAGYHAGDGLTVLKAAAQGAAAEGANTTDVAKALTDILVDYHLKASDAANITSKMVEAVAHGKTNLQDFSKSFANIVPAASAAGISFQDVMGALSNMTNHGFTAQRASFSLAQALRSLLNPTAKMKGAFEEFGVSSKVLQEKLHGPNGLTDAMEYLSQSASKAGKEGTPEFAAALKMLMGTAPGANAALSTVGKNMKATATTIRAVGGATSDADGKVKGFALVQKSLGQQTKQLQAGFQSLLIELGQKLIPILTVVVGWFAKHQTATMLLLGAVTGLMVALTVYAVTVKTVAMVTTIWSTAQRILNGEMEMNPIGLVIIAIAALVAGIIIAYKHSKTFRDIIRDVGHAATTAFRAVIHAAEAAFNWIKDHWRLLASILTGPIGAAVIYIVSHWHQITSVARSTVGAIHRAWNSLVSILEWPFTQAWSYIRGIIDQIDSFVTSLPSRVGNAVKGAGSSILSSLNPFAHGGVVGAVRTAATGGVRNGMTLVGEHGPELVSLPGGSTVHSNPDSGRMMAGMGGGGSAPMLVVLQMDGRAVAEVIVDPLRRRIRHISGGSVQAALGHGG